MPDFADILLKEALNAVVRKHRKRAGRKKLLDAAKPKPPATGGTGQADFGDKAELI